MTIKCPRFKVIVQAVTVLFYGELEYMLCIWKIITPRKDDGSCINEKKI